MNSAPDTPTTPTGLNTPINGYTGSTNDSTSPGLNNGSCNGITNGISSTMSSNGLSNGVVNQVMMGNGGGDGGGGGGVRLVNTTSMMEVEHKQSDIYDLILAVSQAHFATCNYTDDKIRDLVRKPVLFVSKIIAYSFIALERNCHCVIA